MREKPKSEGTLQFEREIAELNLRLVRGELSEHLEPGDAFITILRNTVSNDRRYRDSQTPSSTYSLQPSQETHLRAQVWGLLW